MRCPYCGAESTAKFCEYCGSELIRPEPDTTEKQETPDTIVYKCYVVSEEPEQEEDPAYSTQNEATLPEHAQVSPKSKIITLILCSILGIYGVHYFYVGKKDMGILYLCTGGLFIIGWIVDIIRIARGTFTDGNGLPIKTPV